MWAARTTTAGKRDPHPRLAPSPPSPTRAGAEGQNPGHQNPALHNGSIPKLENVGCSGIPGTTRSPQLSGNPRAAWSSGQCRLGGCVSRPAAPRDAVQCSGICSRSHSRSAPSNRTESEPVGNDLWVRWLDGNSSKPRCEPMEMDSPLGEVGGRGKRRKEGEMSGGTLQGQLESEGQ